MKNVLRYLVPLFLAIALMWFVFKDIDLELMFQKLRSADPFWLGCSFVVLLLAHAMRAWRWQMLLEPIGPRPAFFDTYVSVLTGYFANYILPRMGEVTRAGTLYKLEGIPVNAGFGTVVAERIFDVITLLLLIGLNFLLEFDRLSGFFSDFLGSKIPGGNSSVLLLSLAVVGVAGLVGAWLLWRNEAVRTRLMANPLVAKITGFVGGMLEGLLSIRKLKNPGLFVLSTVLIWVFYYYSSYVLFFCIPETANLGWLAGLTVLVIGALSMTVPTQGGIGAYHLLVGSVMGLYGLSQSDGITLATFIHGSQMLLMLLVGALAFLVVLFKRRAQGKGAKEL